MPSDSAALDIIFVSDFHAGPSERPGDDENHPVFAGEAFVAFASSLIDDATGLGRQVELVILGDGLHFPASVADTDTALTAVDAIARTHPQLVQGLRLLLEQGYRVVMVAGNHDAQLHRPAVQQRLRQHVGQQLCFEPWIYYRPGQVYAEHGSQYHDISRVSTLIDPFIGDLDGPMQPALSSLLEAPASQGLRTVGALLRDRRDRLGRSRYRGDTLRDHAKDHRLDHQTLVRLDRVGQTPISSTVARLARKLVGTPTERVGRSDAYLTAALDHVDAILESSGHAVPNLVFGHTHLACRQTRAGATYLNCGTWSRPRATDAPLPYVRLRRSSAELLTWNGSTGSGNETATRSLAEQS